MGLPRKLKKADIYIGVIIAVGIFLLLSQAVVSLVFSAYDLIIFTRSRTSAQFLAEEKIETAKNLDYNDLGTVGGIPAGVIPQTEAVVANGLPYTVTTRVDNIDDPFDGVGAGDENPVDYKRVEVEVSWGGLGSTIANKVSLVTDISPQRNIDIQGGVLDISVINASGAPVPLAEVSIIASGLTPPVNTTLTTDSNGKLVVPGSQPCSQCYKISVTKAGYSTDRTYSTNEVTNPTKPDATVTEGQVSNISFIIDLLGSLNITSTNSRENSFSPLPNQQFILRGEKVIGTDSSGTLIYKYAQVLSTDASANLTLPNMEWDRYHIIIPTGAGRDVSGVNPLAPVVLNPSETKSATFASTTGSTQRLFVSFTDSTLTPVASVAATLKENSGSFEASSSSGLAGNPDYGQLLFSNLSQSTYSLYATASGFLEYTNPSIIVNDYTKEQVVLVNQ